MTRLSLTLSKKLLKPSKKNVSMSRMDVKKLHTWEFQLRDKRGLLENQQCSKHLLHIAIEKDILSEQMNFSNISQISHNKTPSYSKNTLYTGIKQF